MVHFLFVRGVFSCSLNFCTVSESSKLILIVLCIACIIATYCYYTTRSTII